MLKFYVLFVIVSPIFTFYLYCRGRALAHVGRFCGQKPLHIYMVIKYVQANCFSQLLKRIGMIIPVNGSACLKVIYEHNVLCIP